MCAVCHVKCSLQCPWSTPAVTGGYPKLQDSISVSEVAWPETVVADVEEGKETSEGWSQEVGKSGDSVVRQNSLYM